MHTTYCFTIITVPNAIQNVYIGISCASDDQFGSAVDDFKVTVTTLSTDTFFKLNFAMYPNPAQNVLNISGTAGLAMDNVVITDLKWSCS